MTLPYAFYETVDVFLNMTAAGSATTGFASAESFPAGINAHSIIVADVSGDGKSELAVVDDEDKTDDCTRRA